jgi:hypothetical protein
LKAKAVSTVVSNIWLFLDGVLIMP